MGCRKFVDPGLPRTQLNGDAVFASDVTATGAMLALYSQMEGQGIGYALIANTGLSSDELRNHSALIDNNDLANNNLSPENGITYNSWSNFYKFIYQCNLLLEKLERSHGVSEGIRQQLQGEAMFTRAFCNFYLLQLFGKIPLVTASDYTISSLSSRQEIEVVYAAIKEDLQQAKLLLDENYKTSTNGISTERVRPNKFAVEALLARVCLYQSKWQQAEASATSIISKSTVYQLESNLNNVFLKATKEAIWQWMAVAPRYNTFAGGQLILTSTPSSVSLQPAFLNVFASSDNRKANWTKSITVGSNTYFYPFKYKVGINASSITEYSIVFRLAEQFLIRAEARLQQDNLAGAESDLNMVRIRAGLLPVSSLTRQALSDSIDKERRRELFCEFGDRWINLKRNPAMDAIMTAAKGSNWATTDRLYPIPQTELIRNPNLDQNPGY